MNGETAGPGAALTVSQLNEAVRGQLEGGFPLVLVEGELSNLARPGSGHLYFTLKDSTAQVRCALFRNRARLLGFRPGEGMQVLARARVSLYVPRGDYQLIVEHLEEAGDGALRRAFEALRSRLQAEGLFNPEEKRPLPHFPRRVGVLTSPTGAAIRDILSVLRRRFPALPVLIHPVPVQGPEAAPRIVRALQRAGERGDCDVLILARGGGSLEDLWAFNEEALARAIRACPVPVVSGVGHETDVTIADFAADLRAATPSAAAELVSPDGPGLTQRLLRLETQLAARFRRHTDERRRRLAELEQRLRRQHPEHRLQQRAQRLDEMTQRLQAAMDRITREEAKHLEGLGQRLLQASPRRRLEALAQHRAHLSDRLHRAMALRLERLDHRVAVQARSLHTISPLATLGRGYSILMNPAGQVVREPDQAPAGTRLEARLARGRLACRVVEAPPEPDT
ncbi:MAG: exodeoxyribonuclease VII large subunit [Ectothiorhodospira sp.]